MGDFAVARWMDIGIIADAKSVGYGQAEFVLTQERGFMPTNWGLLIVGDP